MKRKQVLFHHGKHEAPMTAVLKRYAVGSPDHYGRGIWASETDIKRAVSMMPDDPSRVMSGGVCFVEGTNQHNYVGEEDFWRVFNGRTA